MKKTLLIAFGSLLFTAISAQTQPKTVINKTPAATKSNSFEGKHINIYESSKQSSSSKGNEAVKPKDNAKQVQGKEAKTGKL